MTGTKVCRKLLTEYIEKIEELKKRMKMLRRYVPTDFYNDMEKRLLNYQVIVEKGLRTIERSMRS